MRTSIAFTQFLVLFALLGLCVPLLSPITHGDGVSSFTHEWKDTDLKTEFCSTLFGTCKYVETELYVTQVGNDKHWVIQANNPLPYKVNLMLQVNDEPVYSLVLLEEGSEITPLASVRRQPRNVKLKYTITTPQYEQYARS
ncbi:hypothetical protein PTTG_30561 [Puccinia triticina 1-1 BBBD Race 1]|uniref:Uncharacterized protein n=2 Tax=Puccinia triticina TaxID=208348 RepID=A0A180FY99_PUCT1|nr:hypothetical protein PTTG_30561 [Puccinia triticina 1-1 BBBD Race 1]